jgi:hypothetical protein
MLHIGVRCKSLAGNTFLMGSALVKILGVTEPTGGASGGAFG